MEALRHDLEQERDYLRDEVEEVGAFGDILGESPALQRVLRQVAMVAPTDATVLIEGESGTGKECVARALHQASGRAEGPFVARRVRRGRAAAARAPRERSRVPRETSN